VNNPSRPPDKHKKPNCRKETLFGAFIELLKVKTIITLIIITVMSHLALTGIIAPETFMTVAGAVVTYYFTRREDK
jgi:hypothetical protein